ncbi:PREDICTED: uncharacterized protein LOC105452093 [Wasmannia auropunctata]|uniref:uncharacterized protein LOC105452093 n=1 Tax=Wasmannia auropunctata TaxID=64793 RepID=UPI0005F011EC|nr:PREDICTED: uncharacterized protein LOC105452093 [Wasmannia auropunctata]
MEHRSLFRFVLALTATIEVTSAPISDFGSGRRSVWQNVGRRSFYGPWDIAVKRNGNYIDYNDYDVYIEQFRPNSPELPYGDVPIANGYIDASPSVYDSGLSELNTLLSSVGLADFRTGVRPSDWIDRSFKEDHWEDIASHEVDEDT